MSAIGTAEAQSWMSRRTAFGLIAVSALSLIAFFVLNAYAPELRPESTGGTNVLSKSAVGFAGLKILLDETGMTTIVDRGEEMDRSDVGLTILTPEWRTAPEELAQHARGGIRLVVLPKWLTVPDQDHSGWVMKVDSVDTKVLAKLLGKLSSGVAIDRRSGTSKIAFAWAQNATPVATVSVDSLQTLSGKDWTPYLFDDKGRTVIGALKGTDIYVLADPDLLNTHGLNDPQAARLAARLVHDIRGGQGPIDFDVTLNGLRRAPNYLRDALEPPFLGATLCALFAALLIGMHALSRFGTPPARARAIAFGKEALADSTAGLIRVLGRQHAMAPRYASAMRSRVLKFLGAPKDGATADAWIARAEQGGPGFARLQAAAERVENVSGLMKIAGELYRWKQGIMHERQ